jgi:hypothetical protein
VRKGRGALDGKGGGDSGWKGRGGLCMEELHPVDGRVGGTPDGKVGVSAWKGRGGLYKESRGWSRGDVETGTNTVSGTWCDSMD